MTPTLWLVAEDIAIELAFTAILKAKGYAVHIKRLGKAEGISTLAREIATLIKDYRTVKKPDDCIVVIHDADEYRQPNRQNYEIVTRICEQNRDVIYIVAHDEIESWLLADKGLCKWLGVQPRTDCDSISRPSAELDRLVKKRNPRMNWVREQHKDDILTHVDGSGHERSRSMRDGF